MARMKVVSIAVLALIALVALLPWTYGATIFGFSGSTIAGLVGFFAVSVVLAVHQFLLERDGGGERSKSREGRP